MLNMEKKSRVLSCRHDEGFSLMEVLIAMLVLAIGLLGLASLQAQSLRFNHDSYVRSQANHSRLRDNGQDAG